MGPPGRNWGETEESLPEMRLIKDQAILKNRGPKFRTLPIFEVNVVALGPRTGRRLARKGSRGGLCRGRDRAERGHRRLSLGVE